MKTWHWAAACGLVVGGLAIVAIVASRDDFVPGPLTAPAQSTAAVPVPVKPREAPADGELRVTEQGFTQRTFYAQFRPVYAAFTLENTSTRDVAFAPIVKITYYDRNKPITPEQNYSSIYAGAVMPGSAVTFAAHLNNDGTRVTRMSVEVTGARWLTEAEALRYGVAPLTARDVKILPDAIRGLTTVTYTADNRSAGPVGASCFVIYRDAAGKLLGASHDDAGTVISVPPGDSLNSTTVKTWFPPRTDKRRLQVSLPRDVDVPA